MKFVTLTGSNGQEIRLNFDLVESYGVITEKSYYADDEFLGLTYVIPVGMSEEDEPYIVRETPSQIDFLIGKGCYYGKS